MLDNTRPAGPSGPRRRTVGLWLGRRPLGDAHCVVGLPPASGPGLGAPAEPGWTSARTQAGDAVVRGARWHSWAAVGRGVVFLTVRDTYGLSTERDAKPAGLVPGGEAK